MSIDAIIAKNKAKIQLALMAALVFSLGFASGYYYLDGAGSRDGVVTIRDRSGDCLSWFEPDAEAGADTAIAQAAPQGAALPALSDKSSPAAATVAKLFAGSKNSTLYHSRDCQYVKRIKAENLVWFASQQEAQAAGKQPHSCIGN